MKAGLPDEPLPEKQKKVSHRKRSARDTDHSDDAGPGSSEVLKPASTPAKRSGGIGAAKVVKRPARRGTIP